MNPKEKAKDLVCNFYAIQSNDYNYGIDWEMAKQCALIAVDEIIQEYQSMSDSESILVINNEVTFVVKRLVYWLEVKQEINNL